MDLALSSPALIPALPLTLFPTAVAAASARAQDLATTVAAALSPKLSE